MSFLATSREVGSSIGASTARVAANPSVRSREPSWNLQGENALELAADAQTAGCVHGVQPFAHVALNRRPILAAGPNRLVAEHLKDVIEVGHGHIRSTFMNNGVSFFWLPHRPTTIPRWSITPVLRDTNL